MNDPRGIKLNNPCCIRISDIAWEGKITPNTDGTFEQFDTPVNGLRAAGKIFVNYYLIDGLSTPAQYIARWAPASDSNDDGSYRSDVCARTGFPANDALDVTNVPNLSTWLEAICRHECGVCPYDPSVFTEAARLAIGISPQQETDV